MAKKREPVNDPKGEQLAAARKRAGISTTRKRKPRASRALAVPEPDYSKPEDLERKLTAVEVAERHRAVITLHLTKPMLTWREIGDAVGLHWNRCYHIYAEWVRSDRKLLTGEEPEEVIQRALATWRAIRHQAQELVDDAETQASVKLGCLKLIAGLVAEDIRVRQEVRLLPSNLGRIKDDIDMRFVKEQIVAVLSKNKVPRKDIEELVAVLEGRARAFGSAGNDDEAIVAEFAEIAETY